MFSIDFLGEKTFIDNNDERYISEIIRQSYSLEEEHYYLVRVSGDYVINFRLLGGKGAFGRSMKLEGARISKRLPKFKDACKTLNGRRIANLMRRKRILKLKKSINQIESKKKKVKEEKSRNNYEKEVELLEKRQSHESDVMNRAVVKGLECLEEEEDIEDKSK